MFIGRKKYEAEKRTQQALVSNHASIAHSILQHASQGFLFIDAKEKVLPQFSASLISMFRRRDFANLTLEQLLAPLVTPKTLNVVRSYMANLHCAQPIDPDINPLKNIEIRLTNPNGSLQTAYYELVVHASNLPEENLHWLIQVTDITLQVQTMRELDDLRSQNQTQGEVLHRLLKIGRTRFAAFLTRTDGSMKTIGQILKKPARSEAAFRSKLEETLDEVDCVRRDGIAFKITALHAAAQNFEDALHELRSRSTLSGNDFLPLAVKLDQLFSQFALVRTLTQSTTDEVDQSQSLPKTTVLLSTRATSMSGLEKTLTGLAEHIAKEQLKIIVMQCTGLSDVPQQYQSTVKNITIQMIRNSLQHGIELPTDRLKVGKAEQGSLQIEFKATTDGSFEFLFCDDGCGLDPAQIRQTAILKDLITADAAAELNDRQAIKLIFKQGFSSSHKTPDASGNKTGMSLVRRYVHQANGRIALASRLGQETRFKITLPPLVAALLKDPAKSRVA